MVEFEGESLPAPKDYNGYLINVYGDYMKLPPEEQRVNRHRIDVLDFGSYVPSHMR